jgi:hypothetical protein
VTAGFASAQLAEARLVLRWSETLAVSAPWAVGWGELLEEVVEASVPVGGACRGLGLG